MELNQSLILSFLIPCSALLCADMTETNKDEQKKTPQITPNVNPEAKKSYGVFVSADALCWSFSEGGNCYAVNSNSNLNESAGSTLRTATSRGTTHWDWGFRVGAGYRTPFDGWDLDANWTHFTVHRHDSVFQSPSGTGGVFPGFDHQHETPNSATAYVNSASSHWKMHFNVIDFSLGRDFFVSRYLSLKPTVGLRGAIINQSIKNSLSGGNLAPVSPFNNLNTNHFGGAGLRAGFNSDWRIGGGVSLYAEAAIALLYGHFKIYQRSAEATTPETVLLEEKSRENMDVATTDLGLGFRYDVSSSDERVHFSISLGWEQHMFFGQNRLSHRDIGTAAVNLDTRVLTNNDNLSMRGLTLSASLEF